MRRRCNVSALGLTAALVSALTLAWPDGSRSLAAQPANGDGGEAYALMEKMIERLTWYDEEQIDARFSARMTRESRRFDGEGEVESEDVGEYEVVPVEGERFRRRLTINGRPLNDDEREREAEREAAFRKELLRRRAEGAPAEEPPEDEVVFDRALIDRYTFVIESVEQFRNRPSYVISFSPRSDNLPVVRRIDYALNSARGFVWVDRATHEPARAEFELIRPVRLWWGLLGVIDRARGSIDRRPILGDDNLWARLQYETYTDTRVLFRRTRRLEFRTWSDFTPVGP